MVTVKQVILYTNALPQPPLIQTKYTWYIRTAEGNFKKQYYNHQVSFISRKNGNDTTLSKYVWEVKDKYKEMSFLNWSIVKSVSEYSNITKKCLLCLHENLKSSVTLTRKNC